MCDGDGHTRIIFLLSLHVFREPRRCWRWGFVRIAFVCDFVSSSPRRETIQLDPIKKKQFFFVRSMVFVF